MLKSRNLIQPEDFSVKEIDEILNLAEDIMKNPSAYSRVCEGKIMATLFYEPSTRTRLSFEAAMKRLGGDVIGFSEPNSSSVSKGESLGDTMRVVSGYVDIIVMRHPIAGAAEEAIKYTSVPFINAGDGGNQHPTQTLTDLLTIKSLKGTLKNHTIGLCGDLKHGRTVHSLVKATNHLDESLRNLDLLYMTRVQKERFIDDEEYERIKDTYILDKAKMEHAKEDMLVLHPLPRVNEISTDVDDDERAVYFKQATYGMYVRMALIIKLLGVDINN